MKLVIKACLLTLLSISTLSQSNETSSESFIEGNQQFSENQDKQIEANSWAMCSVAYTTLSKLNEAESPSYASKLNQFGNELSVEEYSMYILYYLADDGTYDFYAEAIDNESLDEILADEEDEEELELE